MRIMNILVDMLVMAGVDETQAIYDVLLATQSVVFEHSMTCPDYKTKLSESERLEQLQLNRALEKESVERIKTTLITVGQSLDMIERLISLGQEEQCVSYLFLSQCNCKIPF